MHLFEGFDYIFYRIASYYGNKISAILLLSFAQSANFLTLWYLFSIPINILYGIPLIVMLMISNVLLLVVNTIRYLKKIPYKELLIKWDEEADKAKVKNGVYMILYFIASLLLFVFSANIARLLQ